MNLLPKDIASLILRGGKTVLILSDFKEAKTLFEAINPFLFPSITRRPDAYSIKSVGFLFEVIPANERICGLRFDNIITSFDMPADLLRPVISYPRGWVLIL